ncbi:NAD metabolism ATPase/kinase [Capnocytophaga sp. H4358]|uniref:DUF4301 family protein n=1 Tax=Capnocytophaga sp. H4358 TaxID=1945658 RepID=UPI000BB19796|nr:DUF4301 family protein [Capnocytophaga sp. H4358]ATA71942.1 NAD metabolism ATPase/kinase [Capnocytophaga sp. H4358]
MTKLTQKDQQLLTQKGITEEMLHKQIALFKEGVPPIELESAATIGNGIISFSKEETAKYAAIYQKKKKGISILKFVPASGAATRMFKSLFAFKDNFDPEKESFKAYIKRKGDKEMEVFFNGLEKFAFYPILMDYIAKNIPEFHSQNEDNQKHILVSTLLGENGLNYGNLPKGLLPFHKHSEKIATAFEEHFRESVMYASGEELAHLHFTITEQHTDAFNKELSDIKPNLEERYNIKFDVNFSYQKPNTDTVSVTESNEYFRDENGNLLFRPSGHGALLDNLNEVDADVIFIKNIDNVVVKKYTDETVFYKEALAGKLREVQSDVFHILKRIENNKVKKKEVTKILNFLKEINIYVPDYLYKFKRHYALEFIEEQLNRPIRVCGMVKNEGEPGGGPFWVRNSDGNLSLQIIESAQVDLNNPQQKEIFQQATHFNPVDLVCGTKNFKGEKFDLHQFVDPKQAFITNKTYMGKPLKALERPGLWNGSMANWITIFVEVPLITFNPVKTVNDLLKKTHQA